MQPSRGFGCAHVSSRVMLLVVVLSLWSVQRVEAGSCSCTPPSDPCNFPCLTCRPISKYCQCWTGCSLGGCPDGYAQTDSSWCFYANDEQCGRNVNVGGSACATCYPFRYSGSCALCPGVLYDGNNIPYVACNSFGSCNSGINGNGICTCISDNYNGNACQYSRANTCNNRGKPNYYGTPCACDATYAGDRCNQCAPNHFGAWPVCTFCTADGKCNGHGTCDTSTAPSAGSCICTINDGRNAWQGATCNECYRQVGQPQFYFRPTDCFYCANSTTCNGRGYCQTLGAVAIQGTCKCFGQNTGANCDVCMANYATRNCVACPGYVPGVTSSCNGFGTCNQGFGGNGLCSCFYPSHGLQCNDPLVSAITPSLVETAGGTTIRIDGSNFGSAAGTIRWDITDTNQVFTVVSWTPTRVTATTKPGAKQSGNLLLTAASGSQSQPPFHPALVMGYAAPVIFLGGLNPGIISTAGGQVAITGVNFAANPGVVEVCRNSVCNQATLAGGFLWSHTRITNVVIPPGTGTGYTVRVTTFVGQVSNTAAFAYSPPRVNSVAPPTMRTLGLLNVTIEGQDFGNLAPQVILGAAGACNVTWFSSSRIICLAPPGRGNQPLQLTVGTQVTTVPYNYDPAVINHVWGCPGVEGFGTRFCATAGGDVITINGYNFGTALNQAGHNLVVTVGGLPCLPLNFFNSTHLTCTTPAGVGLFRPVCVTAAGLDGCANYLSYASPQISPQSLRLVGQAADLSGPGGVAVVRTNNTRERYVTFDGFFFGNIYTAIQVTYGPPENPYIYTCQLRVPTDVSGGTNIKCHTSAGVGRGLVFVVTVGSIASNVGVDQYSYGAPGIYPVSLLIVGNSTLGSTSVTSTTTLGEIIQFQGYNFGPPVNPYLYITYGPNTSMVNPVNAPYVCSVQQGQTDSIITCKTARQDSCTGVLCGTGVGNVFRVTAGLGSSGQTVLGNDTYNYPTAPMVTTVSGCPLTEGSATAGCPTDAKSPSTGAAIRLTITGLFFGTVGAVVTVGTQSCTAVVHLSSAQVTCTLPVGAGINQPVVLSQGALYSRQAFLLSYAFPALFSVSGCHDVGPITRDCERNGNTPITLTGSNFGPTNAKVLVDGLSCRNVQHIAPNQHRVITCLSPAGTSAAADVLVIQDKGQISAATVNGTLGYAQCAPGEFAAVNVVACSKCAPGTFSNVVGQSQTSCIACSQGTYAHDEGASECLPCDPGSWSDQSRTSTCSQCGLGKYAIFPGATQCHDCNVGNYADSVGFSICTQCQPGRFQNDTGKTFCFNCPPGNMMVQTGQSTCVQCDAGFNATLEGTPVCLPCPQGSYSTNGLHVKGSLTCSLCAPGKFTSSVGRDACTECEEGYFSDSFGSAFCTQCDPGRYANATGFTSCYRCSPGSATLVSGSPVCSTCAPGTFADDFGYLECTPCSTGTYQTSQGATVCDDCNFGSAQNLPGQPQCVPCAPGTFADERAREECNPCPPGTHGATSNQPGASRCEQCEYGKFNGVQGRPDCLDCAAGSYMNERAAQQCKPCAVGYFAYNQGQSVCDNCVKGSAAPIIGSVSCDICSPGYYSPNDTSELCLECEIGRYTDVENSTTCRECPPGTSAFTRANVQCVECADGKYTNTSGNEFCTNCERGRYVRQQNRMGQTVCVDCEFGKHSDFEGFSACVPCEKGKYTAVNGTVHCTDCSPGYFSETFGQTACDQCHVGKSQPSAGQPECADCNPGRFQDQIGQANCSACQVGKSMIGFGATVCTPCGNGTFQNVEGQADCLLCNPGRYSNTTGLAACFPCPSGEFQDLLGALECQSCQPGRAQILEGQSKCLECAEGLSTNSSRQSECQRCGRGFYQDLSGQLVCKPCQPGHASEDTGNPTCDRCPVGTYNNFTQQINCTVCVAGKFQNLPASYSCLTTPAGFFTSRGAENPQPCPEGKVAPRPGTADECAPCPQLASNNKDSTACLCVPGYYSDDIITVNATSFDCKGCPKGADCQVAGVTWTTLGSLPGWWRGSTNTLQFYRCLLPFHCEGGRNSTCGNNREGTLCAICIAGYKSTTSTSPCTKCPGEGLAFFTTIIICILVAAAMIAMYYIILRSNRELLEADKERDRRIMEWDQSVYYMDDDAKMKSNAPVLSAESRSRPNFTYKMKIILGFLQIGTILMTVVVVKWPSAFLEFMNFFSFINFDFVPWQSLGCVSRFNFYTKMVVITLSPIVTLMLLITCFLIPSYWLDRRDMGDDDTYRAARKRTRRKFWKLVLFTLFLLYPGVSAIIMSFYQCIRIEEVDYLIKDFTVTCFDDKWYQLIGYNIAMMLLYPVGVPAFVLYKLQKYKYRLSEPGVRIQLGFLYEAYNNDFWWFELVDLLHKLTLTSLLPFLPGDAIMPFAMVIITLYMMFILLCKPYIRKGDDRLHLFVQNVLYLFCCCGNVIYYVDKYSRQAGMGSERFTMDDQIDKLMSAVLITVVVCLLILFLVMSIRNAKKIIRNLQRRKQAKELAKEEQTEGGVDAKPSRTGTNAGTDRSVEMGAIGSASQASNGSQVSNTASHPLSQRNLLKDAKAAVSKADLALEAHGAVADDDDLPGTILPKMSEFAPSQCDECDDPSKPITRKCVECQQWLCIDCASKLHDRGKRKLHKVEMVTVSMRRPEAAQDDNETVGDGEDAPASMRVPAGQHCEECDGNSGAIAFRCLECKQWLCAQCNSKIHSKGKRAAHKVVNAE